MKIGFANGCFDAFHAGHVHFLTSCRRHCEYLIVAVNSDAYCTRVKGPDRPISPLALRMIHVRHYAEAVVPFEGREDPLILQIRPDVVFKGQDHSPLLAYYAQRMPGWKEREHRIWFAPVIHIGRLPGISTTLAAQENDHAPDRDARLNP